MKQLFILCAILIQSICCIPAGAKSAISESYVQENISLSIPDEESYSLKRTIRISRSESRIRIARSYAAFSGTLTYADENYHQDVNVITDYSSPFYLPLVRRLLFPKHYFW